MLEKVQDFFSLQKKVPQRYRNFIEEVVRRRVVWTLEQDDSFILANMAMGGSAIPLWESEAAAEIGRRVGNLDDAAISKIPLEDLLGGYLQYFKENHIWIYCTPDEEGYLPRTASMVEASLRLELKRQNVPAEEVDPSKAARDGQQYRGFIERVLDKRELWMLFHDAETPIFLSENADGEKEERILLWASAEDAERERGEIWKDYEAMVVRLSEFSEDILPEFIEEVDGAVVDAHAEEGIVVSFEELEADLRKGAQERGFAWDELSEEQKEDDARAELSYAFIQKIVAQRKLWTLLEDDVFAVIVDENGEERVPFWTSEAAAAAECTGGWSENQTQEIALSEFVFHWIPYFTEAGAAIVFCTDSGKMMEMNPTYLETVLCEEAKAQGVILEDLLFDEDGELLTFLEEIVRKDEVWFVHDDDGYVTLRSGNEEGVPIWSSRQAALADCREEWENFEPECISLTELTTVWLPDFQEDALSVFIVLRDEHGINLEISDFEQALYAEIKKQNPRSPILRRPARRSGGTRRVPEFLN